MIRIALASCLALFIGCAAPVVTHDAPASQTAPLTIDCSAHSYLYVGAYTGHWADWKLTATATGVHATLVVVDGPSASSDGPDPMLAIRLPGDCVDFTIWSVDGRGHFVQPYPGLRAGYDGAVDCR
jgi:hypothetical protein